MLQQTNTNHKKHHQNAGFAYIWTAVLLLLLVGFIGLACDAGKLYLVANQLQNAADAAALAAGGLLKTDRDLARQAAKDIAAHNNADNQPVTIADYQIIFGRYHRDQRFFEAVTDDATSINAVKVLAQRTTAAPDGPVSLVFGSVFGVNNADVSRVAIAMTSGGTGAGLICLAPDGRDALDVHGNVYLNVDGGDIQVNSTDEQAIRIAGSVTTSADEVNVCGDARFIGNPEFDSMLNPRSAPIPDPLCPNPQGGDCLPQPAWNPDNDLAPSPGQLTKISAGTHTLLPGFYSGGIEINGGDITLAPGIYIVAGQGFKVGGNASLCAKGVMLFVDQGPLELLGTGQTTVTPLDPANTDFCGAFSEYPPNTDFTYEGISIFQSRTNPEEAKIAGTSLMDLQGTLYFPQNKVYLTGTGGAFGNQLITWELEVGGNGEFVINYDGRNPSPGYKAFLVH